MTWVRLDDQWMDHPKMLKAGRDARDLWLASVTWCSKHRTDGLFPPEALPALAAMAFWDDSKTLANCQDFAKCLLDVCLWEFDGVNYLVHDYLDYNPSKADLEATSAARKEAGRAGGVAKASKTLANGWQKSSKTPSKNVAPPPPPTPLIETSSSGGSADPTLEGYLSVSVAQFSNRIHLIGSSTQRDEIEDRLKELYERGVPEWFDKALKEAEDQNKRNWSYVRAILDRCLREGIAPDVKASTNGHSGGNARVPRGNRGLEALRLVQEEERRQANGEQ